MVWLYLIFILEACMSCSLYQAVASCCCALFGRHWWELVLFVFSERPFRIFLDFEAVCIFHYFRAAFSIFPARIKIGLSKQ